MIPKGLINTDFTVENLIETNKTYKISNDKIQGFIDEIIALKQAIYKVLNTEKYEYPIYGFSYGIELESLIGKDVTYVKIELKRRIKECLLSDSRITRVDNFEFSVNGDELVCNFYVYSIYGEFTITKEATI